MFKLLLLFINIYFLVFLYNNLKFKINKVLCNKSIFVCDIQQCYTSFIVVSSFIIIFVGFFRIMRIFLNNTCYINLSIIYSFFYSYSYIFFDLIVVFSFIFILYRLLRVYVFGMVRFHYLRLHYFFFIRYNFFQKLFFFSKTYIKNITFFTKIPYLEFLMGFGIKILFIFYMVIQILVNPEKVFLGWVSWYILYFFIKSIFDYTKNFKDDFDMGILHCYYPDFFCVTNRGLIKIMLYQRFLILGESEQINFEDNILENSLFSFSGNKTLLYTDVFLFLCDPSVDIFLISLSKAPKMISILDYEKLISINDNINYTNNNYYDI